MSKFSEYEQVAKDNNIGGGSDYWRPQPGANKVRILSEFEAHGKHFIQADNKSYECIGLEKGCVHCINGEKVKPEFLMWVLDRTDGVVKLGQVGYSVVKAIGQLSRSEDWGFIDLPEYDLIVNRDGEKMQTRYTVTPTPNKTPLTAEEEVLVKENVKDLKEIIEGYKKKVMDEMPNKEEDKKEEAVPAF